jgi:DNA replication licensing factor MCM7
LEGLNIDEDGLSDEYDFMEDAAEAGGNSTTRRGAGKETNYKYMEMLQKVANRELDEILVDLDDLNTVRNIAPVKLRG